MSEQKQYTPDMEKLKADLGRTPVLPVAKPEDFAPKRKSQYVSPNWEAELTQRIKTLMRESDDWERVTWGEREALDMIARYISGVCVGRNYWDEIAEFAALGKTANKEP